MLFWFSLGRFDFVDSETSYLKKEGPGKSSRPKSLKQQKNLLVGRYFLDSLEAFLANSWDSVGGPTSIDWEGVIFFGMLAGCVLFFFWGGNMFFCVEVELSFLFFQSGIRIRDEWNKTFWRTGCTEAYNMKPKKEGSLGRHLFLSKQVIGRFYVSFQDVRVRM